MNEIPKLLALLVALAALVASQAPSQQVPVPAPAPAQTSAFAAEQLEQMAAPIALYPDALLMQILMAATYPLEVVLADRWVQQHPGLTGAALEEALKQTEWDPSVKSLCGFPTVLKQMSDNVDWTRDLGDAFIGQKDLLLDTIQRLRTKAFAAGNLKTTEQQSVTQDGTDYVIAASSPEIVYVPSYSPVVVYGSGWGYPYWYYPYFFGPPAVGFGFVSFGIGFGWGFGLWGGCDWHHHDVHVDVAHYNTFNGRTNAHPERFAPHESSGGRSTWTHSPDHRMGVGYRDARVAQQFGANSGASRVTRDQARGYERGRAPGAGSLSGPAQRTEPQLPARVARGQTTPATAGRDVPHPATPQQSGYRPAPRPAVPPSNGGSQRPTPQGNAPSRPPMPRGGLSGTRNPGFDHSASSRGAASRGEASRTGAKGRG
jgi:hypothetical protein